MILPPSTLETMHAITGEEAMPKSWALRRLVGMIYAIDWTIWTKSVDLCLVGGDPITFWARLRAECKTSSPEQVRTIAVLLPPEFSGAPLAALEDDEVLSSFIEDGLIPERFVDWTLVPKKRVDMLMQVLADDLSTLLMQTSIEGLLSADLVQGGRDEQRGEILLRLTRPQGVSRPKGVHRRAISARDAVQLESAGVAVSEIFSRSRGYFHGGWQSLRSRPLAEFKAPPAGRRFADVLIAKQCDILSGFVSPGASYARADPSIEFMRDALGARVFDLAHASSLSLEGAIDAWRADLRRAHNPSKNMS
jgi:hypothetical protein